MSCCYNCPKRQPHCHADCEEYKKYSAKNAERKEKAHKQKYTEQGVYEHFQKTRESILRKHGRHCKKK